MQEINIETVLAAYIRCALWSSCDYEGRPLDDKYWSNDLTKAAREKLRQDCVEFVDWINEDNVDVSSVDDAQLGHDLWLTRNGHGTGFWDRGLGQLGEKLTDMAKALGSVYIFEAGNNRHLNVG